jgi:hypothetical protein
MTKQNLIIDYVNKFVNLTDEETEIFTAAFKEKKSEKDSFLYNQTLLTNTNILYLKEQIGPM